MVRFERAGAAAVTRQLKSLGLSVNLIFIEGTNIDIGCQRGYDGDGKGTEAEDGDGNIRMS